MTLQEYSEKYDWKSQGDIAKALGISRPYYNQILNGSREPSTKVMRRIEANTAGEVPANSWFKCDAGEQSEEIVQA